MAILKKILAPTDFSELSAEGVRYACHLAKEVGAQVIVMNVIILDETNTIAKGEVESHKARLGEFVTKTVPHRGADLKVREVVVAGHPSTAIIDCAENEHIDLVVMSSHGRSGLSRMLIGSVTDKLLRAAKCPVLVVPAHGKA
ncbi:MAG TPA: universal stress protein [Candidatus Binatia bacterium]|nr:universal stress protein [Candidatus Binatia bacterium]